MNVPDSMINSSRAIPAGKERQLPRSMSMKANQFIKATSLIGEKSTLLFRLITLSVGAQKGAATPALCLSYIIIQANYSITIKSSPIHRILSISTCCIDLRQLTQRIDRMSSRTRTHPGVPHRSSNRRGHRGHSNHVDLEEENQKSSERPPRTVEQQFSRHEKRRRASWLHFGGRTEPMVLLTTVTKVHRRGSHIKYHLKSRTCFSMCLNC